MKAGIEANPIYTPEVMDDEVRRLFRFREAILNREGKFKIICYPEQMAFLQAYFGELAERFYVKMDDIEKLLKIKRERLL